MAKLKNIDIAKMINKSNSAISYIHKTNKTEYEVIRLGYLCKKYNIEEEMLELVGAMQKQLLNKIKGINENS